MGFAMVLLCWLCSALLLLEEEHRLHHAVEIDLHALVMLVDLLLQTVGHLTRLTKVITARGYHNRVRVAVDHLHVIVARDLDGVLERVTASRGDELGQSPCVEARSREAQAAIHGVGHDLERLLERGEEGREGG